TSGDRNDEDAVLGELISTASGETNILELSFEPDSLAETAEGDAHTLYCYETAAPEGYLPSEDVYEVTVNRKEYEDLAKTGDKSGVLKVFGPEKGIVNITVTPTPTPKITPKPPSGGVYVKKTSTADPEIMDLDSYTLEGAEFNIKGGTVDETMTTDEYGISNVVSLPDNSYYKDVPGVPDGKGGWLVEPTTRLVKVTTTYWVTETKPPKGHLPNNHSEPVVVTMPDDYGKTIPVHFEDEPYFCNNKLKVNKDRSKGGPIKGVVYKVEFFDAAGPDPSKLKKTWHLETDEKGVLSMDDWHVSHRLGFTSDPFFMHKGQVVIPIDGYLQFTEVAAPAEYRIDDEPFGMPTGKDADLTKH
ncbi:hypothetical protein EVA_10402, partial [gut metagenome]